MSPSSSTRPGLLALLCVAFLALDSLPYMHFALFVAAGLLAQGRQGGRPAPCPRDSIGFLSTSH
jgi:hypothetical protein